ncbi:hypothetical protein N0V90_004412 [Kalmusia sp. IMI 367209]|nr:hypothetical protein N0V90_004412 [Kalmusia sp. IMI 367209]
MVGTRRGRAGGGGGDVAAASTPAKRAKTKQTIKPSAARIKPFTAEEPPARNTRRTRAAAQVEGHSFSPLRTGLETTPRRKRVTPSRRAKAQADQQLQQQDEPDHLMNGDAAATEDVDQGAFIFSREHPISFSQHQPPQEEEAFQVEVAPGSSVVSQERGQPQSESPDALRTRIQDLEVEIELLKSKMNKVQDESDQKIKENESLKEENDRLKANNAMLEQQIRRTNTLNWVDNLQAQGQDEDQANNSNEGRQIRAATSRLTSSYHSVNSSCPPEAQELLDLADQLPRSYQAATQVACDPVEASAEAPVTQTSASPRTSSSTTPLSNGHTSPVATPQSQSGFLTKLFSSFKSSIFSTPKPKPIAEPIVGEFTKALTPTPVVQTHGSNKDKRQKNNRRVTKLIETVNSSVRNSNDPGDNIEQAQIEAWVKDLIEECSKVNVTPGGKRKRADDDLIDSFLEVMEKGMLYGDLNHYSSKPWKGICGMDEELYDRTENTPGDRAPTWAVLVHLRNEVFADRYKPLRQVQTSGEPAAKKQKGSQDDRTSATVVPLNEMRLPSTEEAHTSTESQGTHTSAQLFNSHGQSTSLLDLHPRSCLAGNNQDTEQVGNLFRRSQQSSEVNHAQPLSTSFSVPEVSDEDDEDENDTNASAASPTWTQQPPSAPVMSHAALPTPVGQAPSVPSISGNLLDRPVVSSDVQRAHALRYTPAKPSQLRNMSKPSPSLRSDAGNESMLGGSPTPFNIQSKGVSFTDTQSVNTGLTTPSDVQSAGGVVIDTESVVPESRALFNVKTARVGHVDTQNAHTSSPTSFNVQSAGVGPSDVQNLHTGFGGVMPDVQSLDLPSKTLDLLNSYVNTPQFGQDVAGMGWDDPVVSYDPSVIDTSVNDDDFDYCHSEI